MINRLNSILLLTLFALSGIAYSQDNGEGWFLQGDPVITKDEEIDLPPCYTSRTVTVTNGEGHGSQTYSAECFKEGSGTYSSDVTWTKPPAYMKPGSNVRFSMTFTSPDENPTGGAIKADGVTIVEGSSRNPNGKSTATYTVPEGLPGNELEIYTSFIMISGLHGYVDYKYKYQGAGAEETEADAGKSGQIDTSAKTYCCKGSCNYKRWWSESKSEKGSDELLKTMADSGVRFSALTGQVDIRPDADEYAWRGAGLKSIINADDHVRTGEESWAILSFADMTTFELRPESEVIIDTPSEKDSKISLVCGKVWTNFKKMFKDGTMEVQMSQAVAGIKGTTIVCEETGDSSALKVLDGIASFKSKATGEEILVRAGEMVTATESGLSRMQSFDVKAENASFGPYTSETVAVGSEEGKVIYDSWNLGYVDNNPTCSPFFTTAEPQMVTYIDTYHWNYGAGAPGGTISLRNGHGVLYGPWEVESALDQGEVPRGYWIAHPDEVIPAGTYIVEDSDPATWSQNSESPCGFTKVEGYATATDPSEGTGATMTGIKEPVSSATSTEEISHPSAETETVDKGIKGERVPGSRDEVEVKNEVEASDEETIPHGIDETISSAIKKSTNAAKQEPASTEESTYSTLSAKPLEIRSQVATGDFEWNPQNFAGFYYDLNKDVGTEVLTATLSDGKLSGSYPYGLTYQTTAQKSDFAFEDWGSYNVIGFLGEKCFAGYVVGFDSEKGYLLERSTDKSALTKGQLLKIIADDKDETTITSGAPLKLEEGYELAIKSIDIDRDSVSLELSRNGIALDSKVIYPSRDEATLADKTYSYKKTVGDSKNLLVIAVHFKNIFRGADQDLANVDGRWQLSDTPIYVTKGGEYGQMIVQIATDDAITMNNKGNEITLSGNKDVSLMPGISIETADDDELRYCINKEITQPGIYEIRGTVASGTYAWTADNFAGFYYDLDDDLETESLRTTITDGKLAQPDGVRYTTGTMTTNFEFEDWGSYGVIGFLGERCFAKYVRGVDSLGYSDLESDSGKGYLFDKSTDKSALDKELLLKILADDDTEKTVTTSAPLKLEEGYELAIKSISPDGNIVYLELHKDGNLVDSRFIYPSQDNATMADKTYIYKDDVGDLKNMVVIAVHFKNSFRGADQNLATINGVWQISNSPISVKGGASFGRLVISDIAYGQISMKNKDNPITLSKNKYIPLAGDIYLQTANSDTRRYYPVREVLAK